MHCSLIAFYLPQFHPIPENDEWWGKGFTEWINVAKARPLFKGHYQPNLPGELGFYDLRLSETREEQAELAKNHGISAFCYWHYWFGNGRTILETPLQEVLASGKPDFPFCLAWANQTWTGIWHGAPDRILIEQKYPGEEDYKAHFYHILPALKDDRYFKVDDRPLIVVFRPKQLPHPAFFLAIWRKLAVQEGLREPFFVGFNLNPNDLKGFDGTVRNEPSTHKHFKKSVFQRALKKYAPQFKVKSLPKLIKKPEIYDYSKIVDLAHNNFLSEKEFPMVIPNWDNTPRSGARGLIYYNSTPELFKQHLEKAADLLMTNNGTRSPNLIFLKAWNEWAEGNYVEPDRRFGRAYLEAIKEVMCDYR